MAEVWGRVYQLLRVDWKDRVRTRIVFVTIMFGFDHRLRNCFQKRQLLEPLQYNLNQLSFLSQQNCIGHVSIK